MPEIKIKTRLNQNLAGIVIEREINNKIEDWIHWPESHANSDSLPCIPMAGNMLQGNNAILSSFGTTDWTNLRALVKNMLNVFKNNHDDRYNISVEVAPLSRGLKNLNDVLSKWPMILRFDSINLTEIFEVDDYHRLGITLTNISLGNLFWPSLEYRVATVSNADKFEQNPRLEFLESTSSAFEHWFSEHDEVRGSRLELRFAEPHAMDTNVWNNMSEKDRLLVAGIINSLPMQLTKIQSNNPTASLSWDNWHKLGANIKSTLQRYIIKREIVPQK